MRRFSVVSWMMIIGIAVAEGTGYSQPLSDPVHYVLTDREAIAMLDVYGVDMVAPQQVMQGEWSSNSRYVLAGRVDLELPLKEDYIRLALPPGATVRGEVGLFLWNSSIRRSEEIWRKAFSLPGEVITIEQIAWLPGKEVAIVKVLWEQPSAAAAGYEWLRVDAASRQAQPIRIKESTQVILSPLHPIVILADREDRSLRVMQADGSIGQPVPLPEGTPTPLPAQWSQDGHLLCMMAKSQWHAFDVRSGAMQVLAEAPKTFQSKAPSLPVRLQQTSQTLKQGETSCVVRPLWLESVTQSDLPRTLVSPDSEWGKLSPDGSAVLYAAQGITWVKPLVRMPREQMLQTRAEASQVTALSNAKQIGTALLAYAQDNQGELPPADALLKDLLMPYIKSEKVLGTPGTNTGGFVYVYRGGSLSTIKEPGEMVLGYVRDPGGRAVIYADGHITWENP